MCGCSCGEFIRYSAKTYNRQVKYATLPLLLAAFFKLPITAGLMLSRMNRFSSPGYKDLRQNKRRKKFVLLISRIQSWIYAEVL